VKDGPLQFTLRRLQAAVFSPRFWAVLLAVAVVLGLTGPFGTFNRLPLLPRFGYWLAVALATFLVGYATIGLMLRYLPGTFVSRPLRIALAGFAAGVPVTVVAVALNHALLGDAVGPATELAGFYIECSLIAAVISFLFSLVESAGNETDAREPDVGPATADSGLSDTAANTVRPAPSAANGPPPLLERLPVRLRGRLLYLSMQDHYVDVHTDKGSALVLMRFGDAIRETGNVAGLQIHRSHWIALNAVEGPKRQEGRLFLKMTDGALLPVSRGAQESVRAAGIA
jgi:DNA-binding LytR/AlgR family response regulator